MRSIFLAFGGFFFIVGFIVMVSVSGSTGLTLMLIGFLVVLFSAPSPPKKKL